MPVKQTNLVVACMLPTIGCVWLYFKVFLFTLTDYIENSICQPLFVQADFHSARRTQNITLINILPVKNKPKIDNDLKSE